MKRKSDKEDGSEHDKYGDLKNDESAPHGYLKDHEVSDFDVFSQEFFLHAYSLFSSDRPNFVESREGRTWVKVKHHEMVAKRIIPLIRGPCGDL